MRESERSLAVGTLCASGVTLIELLIVMAILSLAAAFVGPAVGAGLDNMALRSAGSRVVSVFRQVQAQARRGEGTLAVRASGANLKLVTSDGAVRTVELDPDVRLGGPEGATYLFMGTGQIVGPGRLTLENRRGRQIWLVLGPFPGQIGVDEADGGSQP
jgi:prepilin-type N-terminal cleavage/methylation domain-containing protein